MYPTQIVRTIFITNIWREGKGGERENWVKEIENHYKSKFKYLLVKIDPVRKPER